MRTKIAFVVSISALVSLYIGMQMLAKHLGLATYEDFGEAVTISRGGGRYSYDDEVEGATTDLGYYILIISAMLAWRIFHWVLSGKINGNLRVDQKLLWSSWFWGMSTFIVLSTPIWQIEMTGFLQRILVMAIGFCVLMYFYHRYTKALHRERLKKSERQADQD
jgi:hypothetical protein